MCATNSKYLCFCIHRQTLTISSNDQTKCMTLINFFRMSSIFFNASKVDILTFGTLYPSKDCKLCKIMTPGWKSPTIHNQALLHHTPDTNLLSVSKLSIETALCPNKCAGIVCRGYPRVKYHATARTATVKTTVHVPNSDEFEDLVLVMDCFVRLDCLPIVLFHSRYERKKIKTTISKQLFCSLRTDLRNRIGHFESTVSRSAD